MYRDLDARNLRSPILVIAPHPDDDILSSAGLIQSALRCGKSVFVLFMTVGDGFVDALKEYLEMPITTPSYRYLGRLRYQESVRALKFLGVPRSRMFFLGFPDGVMSKVLRSGRNSIRSPYTKFSKVPYAFACRKGAVYSRASALQSIHHVFHRIQPRTLIVPHQRDTHPDHVATRGLILSALRQSPYQPTVFSYLIHYPNYPNQEGALRPPTRFRTSNMYRFVLTQQQRARKRSAFNLHRTQYFLCKKILRLVRTEEWFWKE